MLKKILGTLILSLLTNQIAYAKVIELNSMNADQCRQQIIKGGDETPMIFLYITGCSFAKAIRPIYEEVSEQFPDRRFYAFSFADFDDSEVDYKKARTAQGCLGFIPMFSPQLVVYEVTPSSENSFGRIRGLMKMKLAGDATKADIINYIEPIDPDVKNRKRYTMVRD